MEVKLRLPRRGPINNPNNPKYKEGYFSWTEIDGVILTQTTYLLIIGTLIYYITCQLILHLVNNRVMVNYGR